MPRLLPRPLVVVLLLLAAGLAAPAGAAAATGPHRDGRFLGVAPHRGTAPALRSFAVPQLTYHGGPVMHANTTHAIYWRGGGTFPSGYQSTIDTYLGDVAHDSGLRTNVYSTGLEYTDGSGRAAYDSAFAGGLVDTDAYPASDCPHSLPYTRCVTDQQVIDELDTYIVAHDLPKGPNNVYFMLLPQDVDSCFDSSGAQCASNYFCAYHSWSGTGTGTLLYANVPFPDVDLPVPGCDSGERPNGDVADAALDYLSHEHMEAITDPLGTAWFDSNFAEDGDKCQDDYAPALGGPQGSQYNQVINGRNYWLQEEWSNALAACLQRLPQQAPVASFSSSSTSAPTGRAVTFNASGAHDPDGSIASYAWDFGDGATSTGKVVSHRYATSGVRTARLTVTDNDGATGARTVTINVTDRPPAASPKASPRTALAGSPIAFNAGGSSDPDGRIIAYAWDFGDGQTAATASVSHSFATVGTHTARLSLVDDSGSTATAVTTVEIVKRALTSLTVPEKQHGHSVRARAGIGQNGVRFTARLIATRSQLGGYEHTTVGKLVRSSVKAGKLKFSLVLNSRGRRALASRGRLRLTVRASADGAVGATGTAFGRVTLMR